MAKKIYYSMNDVPLGTQMVVKSNNKKVVLVQKFNFPTTFVTKDENGLEEKYYTYEVDIIDWPPQ
ncbi:MAG: hypothetical protein CMG01_00285 [Candidatus Marinimicrobia bacterium]|nr:hypothetical protein [Candidatus Neomarinimicrobiota bacterium]